MIEEAFYAMAEAGDWTHEDASRAYRCHDNSLVYIDFFSNNPALVRSTRGGAPTILTAQGGQPPYTAPGYSVSANSERISYTSPSHGTQACHT